MENGRLEAVMIQLWRKKRPIATFLFSKNIIKHDSKYYKIIVYQVGLMDY